jgi:putative hydrolase of the HAD superfamily
MTAARPLRIVFDLGAVVLRWQPAALLQRLLPEQAHDAASTAQWVDRVFQAYGGDWAEYDRGTVSATELVARIAARTGLAAAAAETVVAAVPDELLPMPESLTLIDRLRAAGHTLHYLSNMPAPCADTLEQREAALFARFESGVFSSRVHLIKPEPAIYTLAQQRFGVPAQQLVFLDDHEPNVVAARAAGWKALRFEHALQAEAELRAAGWLAG